MNLILKCLNSHAVDITSIKQDRLSIIVNIHNIILLNISKYSNTEYRTIVTIQYDQYDYAYNEFILDVYDTCFLIQDYCNVENYKYLGEDYV